MPLLDFDRFSEWKQDSSLPNYSFFPPRSVELSEFRKAQSPAYLSISRNVPDSRLPLIQALSVCSAFNHLPIEFLNEIAQSCVIKSIPDGSEIWHQGDEAHYFLIILEGLVEMSVVSSGGTDHILGLFGTGDVVGIPAIVAEGPYPASAKASNGAVKVLQVYSTRMAPKITHHSGFQYALKNALVLHDRILRDKIDVLCAGRIEQRLALLFFRLARRFGSIHQGSCRIPFHFSRNQISKMVDARLETVIRMMSRLEKSGLLKRTAEGFVVPCCLKFEELMECDEI